VQAELDLYIFGHYERFEDWASKLGKRNVSDCQLDYTYYIIPPPPLYCCCCGGGGGVGAAEEAAAAGSC